MILSRNNLQRISDQGVEVPTPELFTLPEKVLQFGTGVLLRGLPDYFIDKANKQGIFNGRIVVVKSTDVGSTHSFDTQDGLYTIQVQGIENGQQVNEQIICGAISRVLAASSQWQSILEVAASRQLEIVISNTTEVGIQFVKEDILTEVPASYPGKLLAVLYHRYKAFSGSADSGLIIIPTELLINNASRLKSILLELARHNNLDGDFIQWLDTANRFCNSLVDRIVPGKPAAENQPRQYTDHLSIIAEPYRLWAIEGDEYIRSKLSFSQVDPGVVIALDIELFRELKLRLLNGTHTLSCSAAIIAGHKTVKDALADKDFCDFVSELMFNEILPSIPYPIEHAVATNFARQVLDRFRNPSIEHKWLAIAMQYTAKIKLRVLPLLFKYYENNQLPPPCICRGIASYLRLMKTTKNPNGGYEGYINGERYVLADDAAPVLAKEWEAGNVNQLTANVFSNKELWDEDLNALPGFTNAVARELSKMV